MKKPVEAFQREVTRKSVKNKLDCKFWKTPAHFPRMWFVIGRQIFRNNSGSNVFVFIYRD